MKVIKLISENVKGLKAVEIIPDDTLQIISGKNGQGKSSVMDSIWLALGGSEAIRGSNTSKAIRNGEDSAMVELDLGDIVVTRKWTSNDKSSLKVKSKDGSQFKSPQTMLNSLIGRLSFDPLSFSNLDNKTQVETLMNLIDLEKSPIEFDKEKKELFDERALINKDIKNIKLQLSNNELEDAESIPDEEIISTDIIKQIQDVQDITTIQNEKKSKLQINKMQLTSLENERVSCNNEIASLEAQIELIKNKKADIDSKESRLVKVIKELREEIESTVAPNINELNERLLKVEETNSKVRMKKKITEFKQNLENKTKQSSDLTQKMKDIELEKEEAIKNANFPIEGLSVDESGVLLNQVPLSQCSSAERLKVSMSIAMSLNPKLRVIRIMDGSLLDSTNLELIRQMAGEKDYQIWVEQVDESGTSGIVIEDGEIKNIEQLETPLETRSIPDHEIKVEPEPEVKEELEEEMYSLSF